MKHRYIAAMIVSLLAMAMSAAAQDKATNFSGTWELDVAKSKLGERGMIQSQTLTVTQTGKEITVQTATKRTPPPADTGDSSRAGGRQGGRMGGGFGGGDDAVTYSLDGKEVKTEVEGRNGKMPVIRQAKVNGGKLKLSSSRTFTGPMGEVTMTTNEKWELSSDGKTLIIDSERTTPRGNESTTRIFIKK
jgi:hypothetical protein